MSRSRRQLVATVTVTTTGPRAGADVARLYVAAREPPRQLKAYTNVSLAPGQSRSVRSSRHTQADITIG